MPGPLLTVTVSESTRRGAIAGPLMILGHGLLELTLILFLLLGLAPFLQRDDVFIFVSLVGGSILFWMALSMLKNLPKLHLDLTVQDQKQRKSGALLELYSAWQIHTGYIWWASIGLGYILHSVKAGVLGVAVFFIGHILADLTWYAFISFGVAKGRQFFTDTFYRRLIGCCASFLIIFSCYFFYSGIEKVL